MARAGEGLRVQGRSQRYGDTLKARPESEWLAPISGAVELLAMLIGSIGVVQPPGVVNRDLFTRRRRGAGTDFGICDLEL